jgi:hypothetical protein
MEMMRRRLSVCLVVLVATLFFAIETSVGTGAANSRPPTGASRATTVCSPRRAKMSRLASPGAPA